MSLKPWPRDAVMIIAANRGEEKREHMDAQVHVVCRDCGKELAADSYTIATAAGLESRRGRPIAFLCTKCLLQHDANVDELHDHRGRTPV